MIELGSEFSNGPITAASAYSDSPNDLWTGGFDFFLTGASWDVRCTAISKCRDLDIKSAVIIKPGTTDSKNILDKNIKRLSDFCAQKSEKFHILESMPADLAATLEQMRKIFWAEILNINPRRPARVFIDISTCPRYFSLSLMCDALKSGLVSEVVLGYSEGKYPAAKSSYNNFEELSFTDGVLQATPVPGFFGEFEPSRGKFYLVSMGFDGWKTLNLLIRKEPERVAALLASHVGSPNYEHRARAANAALIERFGIEADD